LASLVPLALRSSPSTPYLSFVFCGAAFIFEGVGKEKESGLMISDVVEPYKGWLCNGHLPIDEPVL
jgi:hypothetical protein